MSSYLYEPIDSCTNGIRLLRLFNGRQHNDRVCGELFEVELPAERDDTYEALSYTWGDPTETRAIVINNHYVNVTTNLFDALLHLKDPEKDRILWVDALCINQQDASERTHQVAMMSSIYHRAWAVVIWLGKTSRQIDMLLEATDDLDRIARQRPRPSNSAEHLQIWIQEGHRLISNGILFNAACYKIVQQALKELLGRSWFRRIWVVQEAANASVATIQCSWTSVSTRAFGLMPSLMEIDVDIRTQALLDILPGPLKQNSWWNNDRSLGTIFQKFSGFESTDPRDQIFALLGLSNDHAKDGQSMQPNYEVDISKAIQRTVFFLAFRENPGSDICCLPDWSLERFRRKLPHLKRSLFEWAILEENERGIPLLRKLIQNTTPRIDVNQQIRSDQLEAHQIKKGLILAAANDRVGAVREILDRQNGIVHGREDILLALEKGIHLGSIRVLDELLSATFHSQGFLQHGEKIRLLEYAAWYGRTSAIVTLVKSGVHPDETRCPHDKRALMIATEKGRVEAIKLLVESGADLNYRDSSGNSPLMTAARRANIEVASTLMNMGADIPPDIILDCIYWWYHCQTKADLFFVSPERAFKMVELMSNRGAEIDPKDEHRGSRVSPTRVIFRRDLAITGLVLRLGTALGKTRRRTILRRTEETLREIRLKFRRKWHRLKFLSKFWMG